eukprot:gene2683-2857_t
MLPSNLRPLIKHHAPPQLDDFDPKKKKLDSNTARPNTKQCLFDEIYALDRLEDEDTMRKNSKGPKALPILTPFTIQTVESKRLKKQQKKKKKGYYATLYEEELQYLAEKQNVRIVRNIVDYIRFFCPTHPRKKKFRLMDIEELLHFPLVVPKNLPNLLHILQQGRTSPSTDVPKPLFSSIPMYSSSLSQPSADIGSKWKLPGRDSIRIEDEMTRKLPKRALTVATASNDPPDRQYPTIIPNTASSPTGLSFGDLNHSKTSNTQSSTITTTTVTACIEDDELRYKYVLELVLRFQQYFTIAQMKPIQWFDILTNYKKDDIDKNKFFSQSRCLYYNEFYYGFMKFCNEMNLIPFKEYEIELIFQYFVRTSLWTAFIEHINMNEDDPALNHGRQHHYPQTASSPGSKPNTASSTARSSSTTSFPSDQVGSRSRSGTPYAPSIADSGKTTQSPAPKISNDTVLPYIRRHDFKLGFKKLLLTSKRILWLNHQSEIVTKCSKYLETLNISLYHYNIQIMKNIHKKQKKLNNAFAAVELMSYIDDDSVSVISTSSLQNIQNLQLIEDRLISVRELESMLSKLINDVMIFVNTKDVEKVMKDYQEGKGSEGGNGNDDESSVISDLSGNSVDSSDPKGCHHRHHRHGNHGKKDQHYSHRERHRGKSIGRKTSMIPTDEEDRIINVTNPFETSANSLLNEELSTTSLFDDVVSEASSTKILRATPSPLLPISNSRSNSRQGKVGGNAAIYPDAFDKNISRSMSRSRSYANTVLTEGENEDEDENEDRVGDRANRSSMKRGMSVKLVAPLLQTKSISNKQLNPVTDGTAKSSPPFPRTSSKDPFKKSSISSAKSSDEPSSIQRHKSVRLNLDPDPSYDEGDRSAVPTPSALRRQSSVLNGAGAGRRSKEFADEDELGLTYVVGDFRNTTHEYTFDLVSRPPSHGVGIGTNDVLSPSIRPGGGRQMGRISSFGKFNSNGSNSDNNSVNSQNSYHRVTSKLRQMSELGSFSHDSQGSVGSYQSMGERKSSMPGLGSRKKSVYYNNDANAYSFDNYEEIKNRHFILQKYSAEAISHPLNQDRGDDGKKGTESNQKKGGNNGMFGDMLLNQETSAPAVHRLSSVSNASVTFKDPATENPHRFYEDYKQFELKMQEEKERNLNNYRLITQNFDRRISLAKVRLNQLYGNDNTSVVSGKPVIGNKGNKY